MIIPISFTFTAGNLTKSINTELSAQDMLWDKERTFKIFLKSDSQYYIESWKRIFIDEGYIATSDFHPGADDQVGHYLVLEISLSPDTEKLELLCHLIKHVSSLYDAAPVSWQLVEDCHHADVPIVSDEEPAIGADVGLAEPNWAKIRDNLDDILSRKERYDSSELERTRKVIERFGFRCLEKRNGSSRHDYIQYFMVNTRSDCMVRLIQRPYFDIKISIESYLTNGTSIVHTNEHPALVQLRIGTAPATSVTFYDRSVPIDEMIIRQKDEVKAATGAVSQHSVSELPISSRVNSGNDSDPIWPLASSEKLDEYMNSFYESTQDALESIGFEHIEDKEEFLKPSGMNVIPLFRYMRHKAEHTLAVFYTADEYGYSVCLLYTFISDGKTLVSFMTEDPSHQIFFQFSPKLYDLRSFPSDTTMDTLYQEHEARVDSYVQESRNKVHRLQPYKQTLSDEERDVDSLMLNINEKGELSEHLTAKQPDGAYYTETQTVLEKQGFVFLQDKQDSGLTFLYGSPAVIRHMRHPTKHCYASFLDIPNTDIRYCKLESYVSQILKIESTTELGIRNTTPYSVWHEFHLHHDTPIRELYESHEDRLRAIVGTVIRGERVEVIEEPESSARYRGVDQVL